jgi:pilus assembly protein CpaB
MKSLGKKLIVLSFVFALICSIVIFIYLRSLQTPKDIVEKITILVAAEDIPPRIEISEKMLKEIEVPKDPIFNVYIKEQSQIVGKYTKETIRKDEGFREEKLLQKNGNEKELAFHIDAKHRAVTLNVNGEAGVANLLKSGDYVDVVVFLAEKKEEQVIVRPDMAKILLQNVRVLAVDRQMYRTEDKQEETEIPDNFLVTLAVPVADIEKLVLAEDIGNIKLVLRPLDKEDNKDTKGTSWQEISINDTEDKEEVPSKDGGASIPSNNTDSKGTEKEKKFTYYTVKRGDTLRSISIEFYGDPEKYSLIQEYNRIPNRNRIINGEVIKIPTL